MSWIEANIGNILKGASIAIIAVGFFASLKTDVAVQGAGLDSVKSDVADIKQSVRETNQKVDKLFDVFIGGKLADNWFNRGE